ncbi:hypothetical protein NDU88_001710 [Pleurodeles waltl]|uniref:Uncharacterized protein n=1 Tax=Pleurodeles waltl TaxID=8319 RepID=A0AAV7VC91_PLEWA|nr:hypothetical protein NDU88_001710 [Pleurodeles waltl]
MDSSMLTLIGEDLHAKHQCWNSRTTNIKGHALLAHSRKKDFVVGGPTHSTHYPGAARQKLDILDIVVMKSLSQSAKLETLTALTSDHNPSLITVGYEIECQQQGAKFNYKRADWYLYERSLDETLTFDPIRCIRDIDQADDCFTDAVHTAIKGSIPQQTPQPCSIYDLPSSLKHSIAEKNRARRQWQKYRTPGLVKKYNKWTKLLRTQITRHRGEKWEAATARLKVSDNSLWRMIHRLTGRKEPNPLIHGKTHLECSNRDKAEVLADTMETSFKPNQASKLRVEVEQEITKHYLEHPPETEAATIQKCSRDEIRSLIKKLKSGKALGKDRITNQAFKMFPNAAVDHLAEIFNAYLQHQHIPKA